MEIFKRQIFVCTQRKMEGLPQCPAVGAEGLLAALQREARAAGIGDDAIVTSCGCLGLCRRGPNVIVYPGGDWYAEVKEADAAEIVAGLKSGRPVERLLVKDEAGAKKDILDHRQKVEAMKAAQEAAGAPPDEVMAMIRGFQEARIVLTAIELDVFTAVGAEGQSAMHTATRLRTDIRATEILLNALAALKLLDKQGHVFHNTPVSRRYLMACAPDDSRDALLHSANMWTRWHHLSEVMRLGQPPEFQEMAVRDDAWTRTFIAAMHKNGSFHGGQVARLLDLKGAKKLLDLGGGSGAYSIAFCQAYPELSAVVFDLPTVIPLTAEYAAQAGMQDRISTVSGDMRRDALGQGFDVVYISAICHMWSPDENRQLFRRVKDALAPGGRIVIQDFVLDPTKTKPRAGAVFAVNMLVGTRGGNSYSVDEYFEWVKEAGFEKPELIPMPGPNALVVATKA